MRLRALLLAIPVLAGCGIVLKAFTVPYAEFCDAAMTCPYQNHLPSLVNDADYAVSWLVVLPAAAVASAVLAVVALAVLTAPHARTAAVWGLNVAAVVSLVFFILLGSAYDSARWGARLGMLGSILIVASGAVAAFTFRSRTAHNRMTAR